MGRCRWGMVMCKATVLPLHRVRLLSLHTCEAPLTASSHCVRPLSLHPCEAPLTASSHYVRPLSLHPCEAPLTASSHRVRPLSLHPCEAPLTASSHYVRPLSLHPCEAPLTASSHCVRPLSLHPCEAFGPALCEAIVLPLHAHPRRAHAGFNGHAPVAQRGVARVCCIPLTLTFANALGPWPWSQCAEQTKTTPACMRLVRAVEMTEGANEPLTLEFSDSRPLMASSGAWYPFSLGFRTCMCV